MAKPVSRGKTRTKTKGRPAKKPQTKTYAGINYYWLYLFPANTKREGGAKLHRHLKADGHAASNPGALAKYVGQLFYSPKYQRLWFRISLWEREDFRALYAVQVPKALWGGIDEADPTREPTTSGQWSPLEIRQKHPLELSLEDFRALSP